MTRTFTRLPFRATLEWSNREGCRFGEVLLQTRPAQRQALPIFMAVPG